MMINVTKVKAAGDYRLRLTFSDGTTGEADLRQKIESFAPFQPLRDPALFRKAKLDPEAGTVVWPGELDIAVEQLYALAHGLPEPKTLEQADANELEMSLKELRRLTGLRQEELAEQMEVTQGAISRLESSAARAELPSLRRYLSSLGWDLEVVAVQGDKRVRLRGV